MTPNTHTYYGFIQPGMVPIEDYESIKRVALSVMSTFENIMDNETAHVSRIKALESENSKLRMKIFDIEGREDIVTTELEHQLKKCKTRNSNLVAELNYCKERLRDKYDIDRNI